MGDISKDINSKFTNNKTKSKKCKSSAQNLIGKLKDQ